MKQVALPLGLALIPLAWGVSRFGMTGHMTAHMLSVAVAAPLVAVGLRGSMLDPAARWPQRVTPMAMMLLELATVWGWHLPALRRASATFTSVALVEQACFLVAGWLLWSAALGNVHRASGIGALLLTSMHMTLLGVLVGLSPRPLYPMAQPHAAPFGLDPVIDQQLGGAVMLAIGAISYLAGGLALLSGLLTTDGEDAT
ncbi:cytochrome c oxidase assembly protein [Novosphingobium malaysiense]|uniref:Membrane protein n=1 Tax=Novosphingobium malaysiense TaxID=1348853 RepID=A0A0B1ZPE8_9SPHN|nr:cytochrome c oxidase assembly protein [Novosphingobium malaysiense]KHK91108.1 membrane protein [Novosphingobium malaysiense]